MPDRRGAPRTPTAALPLPVKCDAERVSGRSIGWSGSHASRNRRSQSSAFSPVMLPIIVQPLRASVQRSIWSASKSDQDVQRQKQDRADLVAEAEEARENAERDDTDNVDQQRQPQAADDHPQRGEQGSHPGEAFADETQRLRAIYTIGGRVSRLMDSVDAQRSTPRLPSHRQRALGRRHPRGLAGIDGDRRAQRPGQTLVARLRDMVVVLAVDVVTCSVMPAFCAKAWNHSRNSSVSISPSLGRVNVTFQIR